MAKKKLSIEAHLRLVEECDERGPLNFDGLSDFVEEGDYEVEEVGFPEVRRRLLDVLDPSDANAESSIALVNF